MNNRITRYFPKLSLWIFLVIVIIISATYSFQRILPLKPQSIHQWRQADCISITKNYYEGGMHFFSPEMHNQFKQEGKVVSEFPVIYYLVAVLWKIFGQHEYIYRLVNVIIMIIGLCCLFKAFEHILKDSVWGILLALTVFVSPIYVYYSNNFLNDTPALNMTFMGWYLFVRYLYSKKPVFFYFAILLFVLAALIKVTAGISLFAIFVAVFIEKTGWVRYDKQDRLFKKGFLYFIIAGGMLILLWILWTKHYNSVNNSVGIFLIDFLPVWKINDVLINEVLRIFFNELIKSFLNISMLSVVLIFFGITLVFLRKINRLFLTFLFSVAFCVIAYLLLFFQVFNVHDYYMINLLIFAVMILLAFFMMLKEHYENVLKNVTFKILFGLLIFFNVYVTASKNNLKYFASSWDKSEYSPFVTDKEIEFYIYLKADYTNRFKALETITPYLRSLGISRDDKVISIPDGTINASLYFMDQKGWTNFWFSAGQMQSFIDRGAKYLIINDTSAKSDELLKPYLSNRIGTYYNVEIYKL